MKKIATLTAAALVLGACGPAEDPAQKYRDALPKAQAVKVGEPEADTTAGAMTVRSSSVLGDSPATQSEYAIASRNLAWMINGGTAAVLGLIRFITLFPPTSCDDSSCTWGPGAGDNGLNRFKLHVTKSGDRYDYTLSGQRLDIPEALAPWEDVISGRAYPGNDAQHGSGTLTIDFEAEARLDHVDVWQQKDFGHVDIAYDNTRSPVAVDATFTGGHNEKAEVVNAVYEFRRDSSGGHLQVAVRNVTTTETLSLHTRWRPTGAGRSDVVYDSDGAGTTADPYQASECWDGEVNNFAEVYDSKPWSPLGTESLCSPYSSFEQATLPLP